MLDVLVPGLATTVQDGGRLGHRHLGIGRAGALDEDAAWLANRLVGNAADAALLECTLRGPRLRFRSAVRMALTGAPMPARAAGRAIPAGRPVTLPAGTELELGACRHGARAYLAFAGGLAVPARLGSRATDLRAGFGGWHGRRLQAGDRLPVGAEVEADGVEIPGWWLDPWPPPPQGRYAIDCVMEDAALAAALAAVEWRVSSQSDRQGLRLEGPPLRVSQAAGRISEPVVPGTVQLPPDAQPIVLLDEAQTIGGYPRLATVARVDLARLAQARSGDRIHFRAASLDDARRRLRARMHERARIELALARVGVAWPSG